MSIAPKQVGNIHTQADLPAGGDVVVTGRIEEYRLINIAQSTAGQTITLPAPTDVTAHIGIDVINNGTSAFTFYGSELATNSSTRATWDGAAWNVSSTLAINFNRSETGLGFTSTDDLRYEFTPQITGSYDYDFGAAAPGGTIDVTMGTTLDGTDVYQATLGAGTAAFVNDTGSFTLQAGQTYYIRFNPGSGVTFDDASVDIEYAPAANVDWIKEECYEVGAEFTSVPATDIAAGTVVGVWVTGADAGGTEQRFVAQDFYMTEDPAVAGAAPITIGLGETKTVYIVGRQYINSGTTVSNSVNGAQYTITNNNGVLTQTHVESRFQGGANGPNWETQSYNSLNNVAAFAEPIDLSLLFTETPEKVTVRTYEDGTLYQVDTDANTLTVLPSIPVGWTLCPEDALEVEDAEELIFNNTLTNGGGWNFGSYADVAALQAAGFTRLRFALGAEHASTFTDRNWVYSEYELSDWNFEDQPIAELGNGDTRTVRIKTNSGGVIELGGSYDTDAVLKIWAVKAQKIVVSSDALEVEDLHQYWFHAASNLTTANEVTLSAATDSYDPNGLRDASATDLVIQQDGLYEISYSSDSNSTGVVDYTIRVDGGNLAFQSGEGTAGDSASTGAATVFWKGNLTTGQVVSFGANTATVQGTTISVTQLASKTVINTTDAPIPTAFTDHGVWNGLDTRTLGNGITYGNGTGTANGGGDVLPTGNFNGALKITVIGDWVQHDFRDNTSGQMAWRQSFDGGATFTPWVINT